MQYTSTRNAALRASAGEAIVTGLAPDGGLFVPVEIQTLDINALQGKTYAEIAAVVLGGFLPDYPAEFLQQAVSQCYTTPFGGKAGHMVSLAPDLFSLELWHGPTAAFKDYALQLLPKLLVQGKQQINESSQTLVLVATSGDTGSAALSGFAGVEGTSIACFYPQNGTSLVQRLQMTTQTADNVAVYAVKGNFDDTQRGVKTAFSNKQLAQELAAKGVKLSSANSINWGRLVPQVVYYITSYLQLCHQGSIAYGDLVDYCVPTGNFGDIMAGYYAKMLGLPIGRLLCASNENNVLADFMATGTYSTKRDFYKTSSPSMDILVSSNLERLLYHESGSDEAVRSWMQQLATSGEYTVTPQVLEAIRESFDAGWADEAAVAQEIQAVYNEYGYLCDTHTAVALRVVREKRLQGGYNRPLVVLSTASAYKFSGNVLQALGQPVPENEFDAIAKLEQLTNTQAPPQLSQLAQQQERFSAVINRDEVENIPLTLV